MFSSIRKKIRKRIDRINYSSAISVAASMCNHDTFSSYKSCHKGQEVAVCGAGPTLNEYVPIEGAIHIALNRAILFEKVKYDYFMADDWDGIKFLSEKLKEYNCIKFFGFEMGEKYFRQIPESYRIDCGAYRYYTDSYMLGGTKSQFVCDIDRMAIGNMPNIALQAMQLALFMNPSKIYIVGCDASSSGHFFNPEDQDKQERDRIDNDLKTAVSIDAVVSKWLELKEFAAAFYPDTKIVSVNPVGLKGIFNDYCQ